MRIINWVLPTTAKDYILGLVEQLQNLPSIILVSSIQNDQGEIINCELILKENSKDEDLVYLGAVIGAYTALYTAQKLEQAESFEEETIQVEEKIIEEVDSILNDTEVQSKGILRNILNNF